MSEQENKNRIKMSIWAAIGLVIGLVIGAGEGGAALFIGAWIGVGVIGNIFYFLSMLGEQIRGMFKVSRSMGDSVNKSIMHALIEAILVCLLFAVAGPIIFIIQMVIGRPIKWGLKG